MNTPFSTFFLCLFFFILTLGLGEQGSFGRKLNVVYFSAPIWISSNTEIKM